MKVLKSVTYNSANTFNICLYLYNVSHVLIWFPVCFFLIMAILLHLNNIVLFLSLFDYSFGCFIDLNEFPSNNDEFWNRTALTLEINETTRMPNLNVQCRKGSYFKIGGGFIYENKNYLDSNTFNCVNGALQDIRGRRFSRQNIECHEKLLCGGQNLTVKFISM